MSLGQAGAARFSRRHATRARAPAPKIFVTSVTSIFHRFKGENVEI
jgi:hypothetical protein